MKKVLALVLAVMMLAVTAFAVDPSVVINPDERAGNGFKHWIPGTTIKVDNVGIANTKADTYVVYDSNHTAAREPVTNKIVVKSINTDNYTITNIKFNEGKKLVAGGTQGIKINDAEERVEVKLAQNYGKTSSSNLNVEFTLKGKKVGKTFKPENIRIRVVGSVGYNLIEKKIAINANGDVTFTDSGNVIAANETVEEALNKVTVSNNLAVGAKVKVGAKEYENGKDFIAGDALTPTYAFQFSDQIVWKVAKAGEDNYGDLDYTTADGDVDVTVRVYKDDKIYPYTDVDPNTDVLKAFADEDAEISFLNSPNTIFNSTATVRIYKEEGATYFYEWVEGRLYDMNGKGIDAGSAGINKKVNWDEDEGCYVLKTRTMPKTMVFSDKPLPIDNEPVDAGDNTPDNPDTGANDVVGIATALAAIALVSAAAVSLKK